MIAAAKGGRFLRFAAAAMVLALALAPTVCAEALPEMHAEPKGQAVPTGHSGPLSSPEGHEDCLWQAARTDASALGQPLFSSLAVLEAPRPLDFRVAGARLVSSSVVQAPLIFFSPVHERAPPASPAS